MTPIFDDPFFIATVNAQTRAMNKFNERVSLDRETTRRLSYEVASRYRPGTDMEKILELVLNLNEPFKNDAERGGYKIAIGMVMHKVRRKKEYGLAELEKSRPFALPKTEQDT